MIPIPLQGVTLPYQTNNVPFIYLWLINKANWNNHDDGAPVLLTTDSFTDKLIMTLGIVAQVSGDVRGILIARFQDSNDYYRDVLFYQGPYHFIQKSVSGSFTTLASEGVSLSGGQGFAWSFQVSGSTLASWRQISFDLSQPATISATDTTFASGLWGGRHDNLFGTLNNPASRLPQAQAIVEVKVTGSGTLQDPYRPNLDQNYPVTLGGFEFDPSSNTNIIVITGGDLNNIQAQINYLKSQGLQVFSPPQTYDDAVSLHNQLKQQFPNWLAGKDNFAYQVLGYEWLEPLAVIDFYYGELIEHKTHYQQLKRVDAGELLRTLQMWQQRLEKAKANLPVTAYQTHYDKLKQILKLGW